MLKKYVSVGVGLLLLLSPVIASAQSVSTSDSSLIAILEQLVAVLTQELKTLIAAKTGSISGTIPPPAQTAAVAARAINIGRPVGFGSSTTGGCNPDGSCPNICHVSNQASLVACVTSSGPELVVFDTPSIDIDSNPAGNAATVRIGSNKTILGPVTLESQGTILEIRDASNIVIKDVFFRSTLTHSDTYSTGTTVIPYNCSALTSHAVFPVINPNATIRCGISIDIIGNSHNIWIDHDNFTFCGEKCIEVWTNTNDYDASGRYFVPDLITISNSRFTNSYFGTAIGIDNNATAQNYPSLDRHERVTLYGNYFRVFRRTPRLTTVAQVHEFNNVVADYGGWNSCAGNSFGFGPSPERGGELIAENNVFEAWPNVGSCKQAIANYGGYFEASGNELTNGATLPTNVLSTSTPMFSPGYAYTLLSPSAAHSSVLTNAGVETGRSSATTTQ